MNDNLLTVIPASISANQKLNVVDFGSNKISDFRYHSTRNACCWIPTQCVQHLQRFKGLGCAAIFAKLEPEE